MRKYFETESEGIQEEHFIYRKEYLFSFTVTIWGHLYFSIKGTKNRNVDKKTSLDKG